VACIKPNAEEKNNIAREARKSLSLGVNGVTRRIDQNKVSAMIVAGDIKPETLVTFLISKCFTNNIPVVKANDFRAVTTDTLGFECIAVGFENVAPFTNIVDSIDGIVKAENGTAHLPEDGECVILHQKKKKVGVDLNSTQDDSLCSESPGTLKRKKFNHGGTKKKQKISSNSVKYIPAKVQHVVPNSNRKNKAKKKKK